MFSLDGLSVATRARLAGESLRAEPRPLDGDFLADFPGDFPGDLACSTSPALLLSVKAEPDLATSGLRPGLAMAHRRRLFMWQERREKEGSADRPRLAS